MLWSLLCKTLPSGQWSRLVMPVNRMLTCWFGFVQRECDRSAAGNTAAGEEWYPKHVCWIMDQRWQRWLWTLAGIKKKKKKAHEPLTIVFPSTLLAPIWRAGSDAQTSPHSFTSSLFLAGEDTKCSPVESVKAPTDTWMKRITAGWMLCTVCRLQEPTKKEARGDENNLMR